MADTVRAAVQTAPRQIEIREFPRPVIGPDDGALLRIEACGICGSDVEQYKGSMSSRWLPMVPGHEPLGIIEEVSESAAARWGVRPGDRVAVEILIPCRSCDLCLAGRYMSCKNRIGSHGGSNPPERGLGLWGGYSEYIHLHPNSILHKMRGDIPAEIAVMFNPLGAGVRWAVHLGGAGLGDTVLILGAGQRGLSAVLAARTAGAGTIIVTGLARDAAKLELAREFGADHTINVEEEDTVERVREITGGDGADVVLELTPMAHQPVRDALNAVRWGGRVVLAGLKGGRNIELPTDMIINKAITVLGAFSVDSRAYAEAIRLIESGRFPLERMHTHTFGLDDVARAIETLAGEIPGEEAVHVAIMPGTERAEATRRAGDGA
ncbi:MAG: zinc-binding dehydrogenase [Streptosporangiaceae bacterium]|nr:zinc-binding dehydrogenase [Streptosporangiaceae bacterium]MBV9854300.1 zinc-binding dehydrogenase [Streptosporangiaceae bacterium]